MSLRVPLIALAAALLVQAVSAWGMDTNIVVIDLRETDECRAKMERVLKTVGELEDDVRSADQPARLKCVGEKAAKIRGLNNIVEEANRTLRALPEDADPAFAQSQAARISFACGRAEALLEEARSCREPAAPAESDRPKLSIVKPEGDQPTVRLPETRRFGGRPAGERNCLSQSRFANLLVQAMGLKVDVERAPEKGIEELTKLTIAPRDGWQADRCTNLDDLCVVLAAALNLNVAAPGDPAACCQAVREAGLPIDSLLPARGRATQPPLLQESDVRRFFATGYAAPLPTARPVRPD
jgi:hypothetical protein